MASTVSSVGDLSVSATVTVPPQRRPDRRPPVPPSTGPGRARWRETVAPLVVTLLAGVVYAWQVGRPGDWRDESATIAACRRSLTELFSLAQHVDLVHLGYYLLAKAAWQLDPSIASVRLISVAAMGLTAGMLVLIGRRFGSRRLGLLAGLLLVVNPWASRYAQEARPFALATLLATVSTWLLLVLLADRRRPAGIAAGYAVGVVLTGLCNVLALMVVAVHGIFLLVAGRSTRRHLGLWSIATVPALAVVAPFFLLTGTQRGQVAWIQRPHLYDLRALATQEFGSRLAPVLVVLALVALAVVRRLTGGSLLPDGASRPPVILGAAWALVPPVLLFAGSWLVPLWDSHYLVFTLPGLSLMLATLVPEADARSWIRWPAIVLPVVLLAALGFGDQRQYRTALGHDEDLAAVADHLADRARPGDAVVFVPAELRVLTQVYPERLRALDDVTILQGAIGSGTLVGVPLEPSTLLASLLPHGRVWVVRGLYDSQVLDPADRVTLGLLERYYRPTQSSAVTDIGISLSVRR